MRLHFYKIGWVRREAAHWIGLLGPTVTVASIMATPLIQRFAPSFKASVGLFWAAPLGALIATLLAKARPLHEGDLELTDEGLVLNDDQRMPLDELEGGVIRYRQQEIWLEIALSRGRVLAAQTGDPGSANAFLEELSRRRLQRRLLIRGSQPWPSFVPPAAHSGWILAVTLLALSLLMLRMVAAVAVARLLVVAATIILSYWLSHLVSSPGLVVARDGLTVVYAFSSRFLPWDQIESFEASGSHAHVTTRAGEKLRVGPAKTISELTAVVSSMRDRTQSSGEPSAHLLDRAGRSMSAWRKALGELGRDAGSVYRGVRLGREELERVLDDPTACAERRIGAALALSHSEGIERIRIAAENTANEHLRIALERVADGALDEGVFEDACRVDSGDVTRP